MADRSLVVLDPGLLTTVQDLGRPGLARYGVSPGGALDRRSLILGNRLVGNDANEAALEITLLGPRLRFGRATIVAVTGADLGARVNGATVPLWAPVTVAAGDEVAFDPGGGSGLGARAYLCVAAGFDLAPVMGSCSTDLFAGFGGWQGRALRAGDALPLRDTNDASDDLLGRRLAAPPPAFATEVAARVVLGPHLERFTEDGLATLLASVYTITARSDRTGARLDGPPIAHANVAEPISEGIAHGSIQVPGDGLPIVLLAARQTVGGYPKIATVIGADLDGLGQLRPGNTVAFAAVDPAEARALTLASRATLGEDAVVAAPRPHPGWSPRGAPTEHEGSDGVAETWTPDGVARVVAALRDADVTAFRLRVSVPGLDLSLDLRRGPDGEFTPAASDEAPPDPTNPDHPASDEHDFVTAPVLGVFYRRSAPDQPPFAEEGQRVEAGQTLGLLEVMKTYHEVTAPRAGVVAAFLVEDGQFVEYGQIMARLQPDATNDTGR